MVCSLALGHATPFHRTSLAFSPFLFKPIYTSDAPLERSTEIQFVASKFTSWQTWLVKYNLFELKFISTTGYGLDLLKFLLKRTLRVSRMKETQKFCPRS